MPENACAPCQNPVSLAAGIRKGGWPMGLQLADCGGCGRRGRGRNDR